MREDRPELTRRHVLILGGTTEARMLAAALAADPAAAVRVTTSLAGRVEQPRLPDGEVRTGGFGGALGLAAWLRAEEVAAVVDATHPFATGISANAAQAAADAGVPLLVLRRPGWRRVAGDRWHPVASLSEAAALLPELGCRVLLTTGRKDLGPFTGPDRLPALDRLRFLVRSVDPPDAPLPRHVDILLDRGPFTLDAELALLRRHRIDVLVTKDSGGAATAPKLTAARQLGLPVVVVTRPPAPPGVPRAADVPQALAWLAATATPPS
ncbi:cobalt-precorrin-6A reductase [Streptacidiphilus anmyonensis]|uniref:cobalt-precorrin-6A reductase n=1 Tax=Streptacidiphilus anmyonensis TaxID=405782 RepID=UPI0005A6B93D|nr:cobalt-precorrin-6A reductase [Streptacidiphilus anmyonensis]